MTREEELLAALHELPKEWRKAKALLGAEPFGELVDLYAGRSSDALLELAREGEPVAARAALEALARRERDEDLGEALGELVGPVRPQTAVFLLRALDTHYGDGLVYRILTWGGPAWQKAPFEDLRALIARRDEDFTIGPVPEVWLQSTLHLLRRLGDVLAPGIAAPLEARVAVGGALTAMSEIGRTWTSAAAWSLDRELVVDETFGAQLDELEERVTERRPVLVVGESGTGRSARLRALGARVARRHWGVLEAGASEVNAGQTYIGQLEARVRTITSTLAGRDVLWIVPHFEELLWAGTHKHSSTGILDMLLRALEGGARIAIAGEIDPAAYERLLRARPAMRDLFEPLRVEPASEAATLSLAERLAERPVAREALALARHYLPGALPGSVLSLLRRAGAGATVADVLAAVAERSGLPLSLLNESERLDVDALRRFFSTRVVGQPEAVECVVERVALVKAGLTDPTRPQAVLLFVGPTGTGKTEIAKALAEFLFGSPERMIRIDLSEYQSFGSARRLLGEGEFDDPSLVGAIRRQPFSVVLLDEFEKADPGVWDLFLQVFDDGRLSDPRGEPADFRHAVIIMTSNLGAKIPTGAGIGFNPESGFTAGSVTQAVTRAFRREFLNRIDRVVVFRPLSRPVMRDILEAELEAVLARRGLRSRDWAVEWDDSALEFLLAEGFTPDLGARPLKRAVERHFLTPLALAIAAHDYPRGDQFLFVRAGAAGLDVTFVDPDAQEPVEPAREAPASLVALARDGGDAPGVLRAAYDEVRARIDDPGWQAEKAALLERLGEPGFWDDGGRVSVLAGIELRDRIEAGARSAGSLLNRGRAGSIVRRAAQRLLLLREALDALEAGEPADALLRVDGEAGFGARVADMYRGWARQRGMRFEVLEERTNRRGYRLLASVGGFASLRTLRPEAGLHVLERPDGHGGYERVRVRVAVAPDVPGGPPPAEALAAAAAGRARIVRRYRERPTPLVRDAVRGWRTGRLDFVLAGGFDLVE